MKFLNLIFVILLLSSSCVWSQNNETAESMLREAHRLIDEESNVGAARAMFLQVADEFPRTRYEVTALLWASSYQDTVEETKALLQRIVDHHPGTESATIAKMNILLEDFVRSDTPSEEAYLRGFSDLAVEIGGPSLDEIITGEGLSAKTAALRQLSQEDHRSLLTLYRSSADRISHRVTRTVLGFPTGDETAIIIAKYLRETFEPLVPDYRGMEIIQYYIDPDEVPAAPPQFKDPTVTFLSPSPGSMTDSTPTIKFETTVGDLSYYQVSIREMKITLDGTDITSEVKISAQYGEIQPGVPYETLNISYVPTTPLTLGTHKLEVTVPVERYIGTGPGKTVKHLNFTVTNESQEPVGLGASGDTTLTKRHPHQNEGANPVLTLEKIQGKAARSAVAFDLADVDLSGLSKATLVLTIDPGQHVNGWGNGRTVSVQALNAAWQEGNGKSFGYKKKDAVSAQAREPPGSAPSTKTSATTPPTAWSTGTVEPPPPTLPPHRPPSSQTTNPAPWSST